MKYIKWPPMTTLDDVVLTGRERELAVAIIGEVVDIYVNYIALANAFRRRENISRREAHGKARLWIYDHRINKYFSRFASSVRLFGHPPVR